MMDWKKVIVAPSILAADFSAMGVETEKVSAAGADWIHCDVMDGHFVDNISFGPALVEAVSRHTSLPLDVHLMVSRPDHYYPRFASFARSITCHVEADHDVALTLAGIRKAGCLAGLAVSPGTPIERVVPFVEMFDLLLIMTVNPGFGGQPFMEEMMEKVRFGVNLRNEYEANFHIEVDGGINTRTARISREAGANVLVAGTSVFRSENVAEEIAALRAE